MIRWSAQDICRTAPWCLAAGCPEDGGPSGYCRRHSDQLAAGKAVLVHVVEQPTLPDQSTHLWCATCPGGGQWKLDAAFNVKTGSSPSRRDRRSECSQCGVDRRRVIREAETAKAREAEAARKYRQRHTETPEQRSARLERRRKRRMEIYYEKKAQA